MLALRRDPMGNRSWGFSIHKDELGGACLVDWVGQASPAAAATYVAMEPNLNVDAALRVNDMIIAINGK